MKKLLIISFLSFAALQAFAQTGNETVKVNTAGCMKDPDMPKNAVPAWPKSAYTPVGNPKCAPCYQYKNKHGLTIMECPFLVWPPADGGSADNSPLPASAAVTVPATTDDGVAVESQNTYTGNYPACKRPAGMPANAKPVWPSSAYTPVGDPKCAPCYEYTKKNGLTIMECPDLVFPPEK